MVWVYTYTDCEGNAHDWSYTYTIDVPDFTVPANGGSTVDCLAAAKVAPTTPNVTDACGNALIPVLKTTPADIACSGDMVWVYTYADCEGNTHDWSYTYTIDVPDFTAPANAGSTVDCLADAKVAPATPTVIDACGNALIPVLKTTSADIACSGDMVWVYTYTDCEGNTHDWSYTYTIDVPDFALPANGLQTVGNLADAVAPTPPNVTDACGNAIVPAAPTRTAAPDCQGTVVYTFNYTDCEGNTHDWTYTYTIELAPFSVPANGSATVNCIADATTPTPPTVSDANGSPIAPTMAQSADPTCSGSKVFTFTYTDCAGNTADWTYTYTIDVPDFNAPANAGSTVDCLADAKVAPATPNVTDACGNAITPVLKTTPADIACSGDMVWVYTYTDCEGNTHDWSYTYTINVPDFTAPANAGSTVDCLVDAKVAPTTPTVIDACGNALIPVLKTTPADIACSGDMVWVYTYTDCEGNAHDWSYTYTIDVPDFTLPANGLQTVGNLADAVVPTPPNVTDACGNAIVPAAPTKTATPDCQGTVVYTFNYTDCEGNTHDWTYTYTIELAPFAVPANGSATVNCIADATTPTPPTVSDANGNPIKPTLAQSADPTCSGSKVFTFTYTDCAGNTADWTYTYTIDLTTKPVVPVSGNSIVECIADATQPTAPIVTDACGNNIIPVITQSADPICEGTKVYTFTYTDCAGNESVYTYTYTIDVSTVPTVPANGSSTVECIADAIQPTAPIVTDVCNNTIIPVITESADPICEGTKVYTFTYTDCAGNVSVYTYTYTVKDTTAPVLTLPANATAECSADLSTIAFGNATATDNCDPNPLITYEDITTNGACPGSYKITRTWKATDACGNFSTADQIISTADTTAPEFVQTNLPSDITVECNAIPVAEILTATDNCGTASVSITEEKINGSCINNYTIKRTWTATDECGLTKSHTQTITVKDTTPPAFVEALPPANLVVECDAVPTAETLTATDICGSATVSVEDVRTDGSCPNSYTITRTWTATDECGLTKEHIQIIVVRDTKAPTFVGTLPPKTLTAECDAVPTADILTAIDNCGDATVTVKDVKTTGDCPNNYTIVRTWVATDECGLTSKYEQIITVKDTKAPVPASTFNPELNVSCTNIPEVPALTFTDNCSSASAITVTFAETSTYVANVYKDYQIIRTWTVKDECGNEKDYKQTLNVALDEIITDIVAPDLCFDEGAINLNNLTPENLNTDGTWELLEGDPSATINGNIFDAKNVIWDKNTVLQGLDYKFRYTTTDNGCISINDIAMTVNYCKVLPCGENDVVISKAVTPNGDAYNESFDISGIELCGFKAEVKIFNRWGALIYESDNYTVGENLGDWKGNASKSSIGNAGKVPNGTYYYIVTIKDSGLAPFTGPVYLGTK
jgi:gliding motility-associated-like protein